MIATSIAASCSSIYYDNIARFVEGHGGAVLVVAGDDYAGMTSLYRTPLSPILPAAPHGARVEGPFRAKITEEGFRHPVTQGLLGSNALQPAHEATWGHWFRQAEVRPDRGRVIMEGAKDQPLLVLDRKGKGRVALLTSDHAWLWARGYDGGGPHTDLLRRLSHWLMKEPDLEEERLIASARGLKLTIERRTLEDKVAPITMSAPGGERSEITLERDRPGIWKATLDVQVPGLYKVETIGTSGPLTAVAHAGVEDPREMSEVVATDAKLRPLIEQTGGGVFRTRTDRATAGDAITVPRVSLMSGARVLAGSGWMGLRDREAFVTKGVKLTPMFTGGFASPCFSRFLQWHGGAKAADVFGIASTVTPAEAGVDPDLRRGDVEFTRSDFAKNSVMPAKAGTHASQSRTRRLIGSSRQAASSIGRRPRSDATQAQAVRRVPFTMQR